MRPIQRAYADQNFPARHRAVMPADRLDRIPWLVAGRLLVTPFASRDGCLSLPEVEAIQAMGLRLTGDRQDGLLPDCTAFWFCPIDGRCTPLTAGKAWLRLKVLQHVVVDMRLLQAMGRVVPLTLLTKPEVSGHGAQTRRNPVRSKKAGIEAVAV